MLEKLIDELNAARGVFIQINDGDAVITEIRMEIIDIEYDPDSVTIIGDKAPVYCEGELTYDDCDEMYEFIKGDIHISISVKN